jgi:Holliday junction resolvasome RuvABC endonuclease subunit
MVGWGLMGITEGKPTLLSYGHVKPLDSKNSLLDRLNDVCDRIIEVCKEIEPTEIAIEDIILFMKNKSQAQTIVILASFNRVIAVTTHREIGVDIFLQSVQSIRKTIKDSLENQVTIKKEDMPYVIKEKLCNLFEFTIDKNGNVADVTRDEADGIAVAWARVLEKVNAKSL